MRMRNMLRPANTYAIPVLVLAATWVGALVAIPGFGGESSVYGVLQQFPLEGLLALGIAITMISGELDLSVAAVANLAGVATVAIANHAGVLVAIVVVVAASTATGWLQGHLIARLRINSLMFTIGSMLLLDGVGYAVTNSNAQLIRNLSITNPFLDRYGIFSLTSAIAVVIFVILGSFLTYMRAGRAIYAAGGGRAEAEASGVSTRHAISLAFGLSAGCAGLAGALATMTAGSASPGAYDYLLLPAVAAAIVGGVPLAGGRGTVVNVALGTAILGTIASGLALNGSPISVDQIAQGALLLGLLAIEFFVLQVSGGRRRGPLLQAIAGIRPKPPQVKS